MNKGGSEVLFNLAGIYMLTKIKKKSERQGMGQVMGQGRRETGW